MQVNSTNVTPPVRGTNLRGRIRGRATTLAAAVLLLMTFPALAGERMSEAEIEATFPGMTLDGIYNDKLYFTEIYRDDGSIRYHDVNRSDSGDWSIKGDTFCTFYDLQEGACFYVVRNGKNCFTFYEAIEGDDGKPKPKEGWTSRGWNRAAPATCPTAASAILLPHLPSAP
jgi:hypothetical protein